VLSSKFLARKNYTHANFFQACLYTAHRAVIFVIAQLSCLTELHAELPRV